MIHRLLQCTLSTARTWKRCIYACERRFGVRCVCLLARFQALLARRFPTWGIEGRPGILILRLWEERIALDTDRGEGGGVAAAVAASCSFFKFVFCRGGHEHTHCIRCVRSHRVYMCNICVHTLAQESKENSWSFIAQRVSSVTSA